MVLARDSVLGDQVGRDLVDEVPCGVFAENVAGSQNHEVMVFSVETAEEQVLGKIVGGVSL
jgi:hypothetical protein